MSVDRGESLVSSGSIGFVEKGKREQLYVELDKMVEFRKRYRVTFHGLSTDFVRREKRLPGYSKCRRVHWRKWESISTADHMIVQTKRTKVYRYYCRDNIGKWCLCDKMDHHQLMYDEIRSLSNGDGYGKRFCFVPL